MWYAAKVRLLNVHVCPGVFVVCFFFPAKVSLWTGLASWMLSEIINEIIRSKFLQLCP